MTAQMPKVLREPRTGSWAGPPTLVTGLEAIPTGFRRGATPLNESQMASRVFMSRE